MIESQVRIHAYCQGYAKESVSAVSGSYKWKRLTIDDGNEQQACLTRIKQTTGSVLPGFCPV